MLSLIKGPLIIKIIRKYDVLSVREYYIDVVVLLREYFISSLPYFILSSAHLRCPPFPSSSFPPSVRPVERLSLHRKCMQVVHDLA